MIKTLRNTVTKVEIDTQSIISAEVSRLEGYDRPFLSINVDTTENGKEFHSNVVFTADKKSITKLAKQLLKLAEKL